MLFQDNLSRALIYKLYLTRTFVIDGEDFLKKNSQISQFIRKFKEDDTFLNEIQLKYISQKKIKILNFKLSKVFEKKKNIF